LARTLSAFLARLDLRPVDRATAELATVLGARYSLRAAGAIHLATAVTMGAHRFITNNSRDFGPPRGGVPVLGLQPPDEPGRRIRERVHRVERRREVRSARAGGIR
jgi:hypothetical protein